MLKLENMSFLVSLVTSYYEQDFFGLFIYLFVSITGLDSYRVKSEYVLLGWCNSPYEMSQLAKARNEQGIKVLKNMFLGFLFLVNPFNKMARLWHGILTKLFKFAHTDSQKPWESHVKTRESAKYSRKNQESHAKTRESLPYLAHRFKEAVPNQWVSAIFSTRI